MKKNKFGMISMTLVITLALILGGFNTISAEEPAIVDDPSTPNLDESFIDHNTRFYLTDEGWTGYSDTSDCVNGWGDDDWELTLTVDSLVSIEVADAFIVGDYYEVYVDGVIIGMTPVVPYEGPLHSVGEFTVALAPGAYLIEVRNAYFDTAYPPSMCPAGYLVTITIEEIRIDPYLVEATLFPGDTLDVEKHVTTPTIPLTPDIYFLCDTTGSMDPLIDQVKSDIDTIMTNILSVQPDAQFGVGNYRDFPYDTYAYSHQQDITDDTTAVSTAIGTWLAGGGYDGPEGQFYALTEIATTGVGWRPDSTKIVVWFGDAPGHDPIPTDAPGVTVEITETTVTDALVAAGINVIAISTIVEEFPYYEDGLDDDPTTGGNYNFEWGTTEDGTAGQATRIAAATGGVHLEDVLPVDIVDAIIDALEQVVTDVWWEIANCDDELTVTLSPDVHEDVPGGTTIAFDETIEVAEGAEEGLYTCVVDFYANHYPEEGQLIGSQEIIIKVGKVIDLYAGAGGKRKSQIDVGSVYVWNDDTNLYVKYQTTDDWYLTFTHLHIETDPDNIPQTKKNNPIPGQFDWPMPHDPPVQEYTYTLSWDEDLEINPEARIYIAAHADVAHYLYGCLDPVISDESNIWFNPSDLTDNGPAVLTYVHPSWNLEVDYATYFESCGAQWIWKTEFVDNPTMDENYWFYKTFEIPGIYPIEITGTIDITCDNYYDLWLNYFDIGNDGDWTNVETYDIGEYLDCGWNSFWILAENYAGAEDPTANPAGLIYNAEDICYTVVDQEETAWGDGEDFNEKGKQNWGMYFNYLDP